MANHIVSSGAATRLIEVLRRQMRHRLKLDIIRATNTTTLRHHLEQVLRRYRIDTVLDVGCNERQSAVQLREFGFTGTIHSFEPIRRSFDCLQQHASGDPGWHCHHLALGRRAGRLAMNVSEFSSFSSMLAPNAFGAGRFHDQQVVGQEDVEVSTRTPSFPEKCRPLPGSSSRWILRASISRSSPAASDRLGASMSCSRELSFMPIYAGMPRYAEALAAYEAKSFSASGFFAVNGNDDLSLIEADCLMVRRAAV